MKNENKIDEMVAILHEIHKYIPTIEKTTALQVVVDGQVQNEQVLNVSCHQVLLGGDQLTSKRARSAIAQRSNSEDARGKLEGFVPVSQDWHAGMCFMQVQQ